SAIPAARVYRSSTQNINSGAETALGFDSERFDTDAIHDLSTNVERLTAKTAGKCAISAHAEFLASAAGAQRYLGIRLNGTTKIALDRHYGPNGTIPVTMHLYTEYLLILNDYVEAVVFQDTGGAINISQLANYSPEFLMHRLSD